jgi:crossover junction endodeoxyribonuclease RuvC
MRVLGIDPGLLNTGWGIIEQKGSSLKFIAAGVIETSAKCPLPERLVLIEKELDQILKQFKPDQAAIEETFVNMNAASSLKLGQARGVAMLVPARAGLLVAEYSTNLIKKSVVGTGHAEKDQIAHMIRMLCPDSGILSSDAADAVAVAICHAHHAQSANLIQKSLKQK